MKNLKLGLSAGVIFGFLMVAPFAQAAPCDLAGCSVNIQCNGYDCAKCNGVVQNCSCLYNYGGSCSYSCQAGETQVDACVNGRICCADEIPLKSDEVAEKKVDLMNLFSTKNQGNSFGMRELLNTSPPPGRTKSCQAKLDVCFGPGHNRSDDFIGDAEACYDSCQQTDSVNNFACDKSHCNSRCYGAFGAGSDCT